MDSPSEIERLIQQLRAEAEYNGRRARDWIGALTGPGGEIPATAKNAGIFARYAAQAAARVIVLEALRAVLENAVRFFWPDVARGPLSDDWAETLTELVSIGIVDDDTARPYLKADGGCDYCAFC